MKKKKSNCKLLFKEIPKALVYHNWVTHSPGT